ncbi:MAG: hypothetical protein J4215_04390 [Candidatus Diapherotrites archaeon]|uniref:Uncharacterized protein n=1 Tax=Candidatus Iainarchaeum sp. TaxID=3101447 RepID=A0A8T4L7B1_9ARCH|nr:hypothetical protein [Candidatus Diapherotrites archaeon]
MSWITVLFGIGGIALVGYGVYVLYRVPKQLREGKTRLTGKLITMGTPDIEKEKNRTTFWEVTLWNIIRGILSIIFGAFLVLSMLSNL